MAKNVKKKAAGPKGQPVLTILVPVYNEEKTLGEILERLIDLPIDRYEVIIVDDASADKSPQIIKQYEPKFKKSKHTDLQTARHPKNRGKGAGIQTAMKMAKGKYFAIQDADLEYFPEDLPVLLQTALDHDHDVVYGSRFLGEIQTMPKANYYANRFYNIMLHTMYDTDITDMHTCYKMLKTDLFRSLDISSSGFGYATELVSKLLRAGYVIHEVPIRYKGRTKKEGKKINVSDGIYCTVHLIKHRFKKQELPNVAEAKTAR